MTELPYRVGDLVSFTSGLGHIVTFQVVSIEEPKKQDD